MSDQLTTPEDWVWAATADSIVDVWPPPPVRRRIEHLQALRDFYDGDSDTAPAVRWCQRACVELAEFMTVGAEDDQAAFIGSVIVDMMRYGGAILLGIDGIGAQVLDPRYAVPNGDGWFYVIPMADENGDLTLCEVWTVGETSTEVSVHGFDLSRVGEAEQVLGTFGSVHSAALRTPLVGEWGTSAVFDGADWQTAVAGRWAGLNTALDKHEQPALTYRIADTDADAIFAEDDDDYSTPYEELPTAAARVQRAEAQLQEMHDTGQFRLPDAVQDMQYVTYDPHTDTGILAIEEMRREFESAVGVPGLLSGLQEAAMSGIALRRLLAPLYAATLSLRRQAMPAVEAVIGPFEWADTFDVLEDDAGGGEPPDGPSE